MIGIMMIGISAFAGSSEEDATWQNHDGGPPTDPCGPIDYCDEYNYDAGEECRWQGLKQDELPYVECSYWWSDSTCTTDSFGCPVPAGNGWCHIDCVYDHNDDLWYTAS